AHRLGRTPGEAVDIAALLEWTDRHRWADTWATLPEAEQTGLAEYLSEPDSLGASAALVLSLAANEHDVLAIGLAARELFAEDTPSDDTIRQARSWLQGRTKLEKSSARQMRTFGEQAEALVARWGASDDDAARDAAMDAERRAAYLLKDLGAE